MGKFIHSRYIVMATAPVVITLAILYGYLVPDSFPSCDGGIVAGWSGQWLTNPQVNLWVSVGVNVLIGVIMVIICRQFNLLRNPTKLPSAIYGIMLLSTPALFVNFYPGLLLCLVILCSWLLMFTSFANPQSQRNIFTVFSLLSGFSAVDYGFLIYMPVFWLGMAQMRVMSFRSILASIMGIITPWIIMFGFGIVHIDQLVWPRFWEHENLFRNSGFTAMVASATFTALLGFGAWIQSFIKLISYNTQSRAQLSIVTVTMFITIIAAAADYPHISVFLPLLTCTTALLMGHQFGVVYSKDGKSYWFLLCIIMAYLAIYVWRLLIP